MMSKENAIRQFRDKFGDDFPCTNEAEDGFRAGWDMHDRSLTSVRSRLKEAFNKLPRDSNTPFIVVDNLARAIELLGGEVDVSDFIKIGLERFLPLRIILREQDGQLVGITEESFSMNAESTRVRIFWSGLANSIIGQFTINGIDDAASNMKDGDFIFDPLDPLCPVEIDFRAWLVATGKGDKYSARNAPFTIKQKAIVEEEDAVLY